MNRISRSLAYAVAAVFPLAALAVGAAHQKKPFTLALATPRRVLKAGEPVIFHVKVTNTSKHEVRVPISEGTPFPTFVRQVYQVHVLDEQGHPAPSWVPPPPPKGKVVIPAGSAKGAYLQPGESLTDEVNISHVYDLTRPGKYKIWIAKPYYRGPHVKNGLARSNTITVTVVK